MREYPHYGPISSGSETAAGIGGSTDQPFARSTTITVVIPVRNRWGSLADCLGTLAIQSTLPYEVIVVDDGSTQSIPASLETRPLPFTFLLKCQSPLGIAAARNAGIRCASGDLILFTDSDCLLDPCCLQELTRAAQAHSPDVAFQLALSGSDERLVWCIEGLRLRATQQNLLTPSGHIRYANTSGLAVRRSYVANNAAFFNVSAVRGEDTFLLSRLCKDGFLPRFVPHARVEHRPPDKFLAYLLKGFRVGYQTSPARASLRSTGDILLRGTRRAHVLCVAWRNAAGRPIRRVACLFLPVACAFEVCGRLAYSLLGMRPERAEVLGVGVDCLRSSELQARVLSDAESRRSTNVTYLTAWSLVQAQQDSQFRDLIRQFDICYADGAGVVLALWLSKLRRIKKVTANDFFVDLCKEAANRQLKIAIIGAQEWVIKRVQKKLTQAVPGICLTVSSCGYLSQDEEDILRRRIAEARPHLVFVGMGQPLQERFVVRFSPSAPESVFFCVGGLFDYIAGRNPTPPRIIRSCGLEWIYRFVHSPKRMWKRYVIGIPLLGGYILRDYASRFGLLFSSSKRKSQV